MIEYPFGSGYHDRARCAERERALARRSPDLLTALNEPAFCANAFWYGYATAEDRGLKDRLLKLTGFHAARPELRTVDAYDAACKKLGAALPVCRNCRCYSDQEAIGASYFQ